MRKSSTERFLKGRILPGTDEVIASVVASQNGSRVIKTVRGVSYTFQQKDLIAIMAGVMAKSESEKAKSVISPTGNGKVMARIGGLSKGEVREYASEKNAQKAIDKHHNAAEVMAKAVRLVAKVTPELPRSFQEAREALRKKHQLKNH